MQRLVCGDVGFGKTEVAMRAIYRAVCAGRQVALLAPTTVLAAQHYRVLLQRMPDVRVELISSLVKRKPHEFAAYGVYEPSLQKRLHSAISKFAARGVPRDFTRGNAWSTMWNALWGGFPEPHTAEETYAKVVSARQEKEAAMLTPRALARARAEAAGDILPEGYQNVAIMSLGAAGGAGCGSSGCYNGCGSMGCTASFDVYERQTILQKTIEFDQRAAREEAGVDDDDDDEDLDPEERAARMQRRLAALNGPQDPGSLELH